MRTLLLLAIAPLMRAQPAILTTELPWAAAGRSYAAPIEIVPDSRCLQGGGVTLAISEGELPGGLVLRGAELSGVADQVGTHRFVLRASSPCGVVARRFALTVSGRPILRATPDALVFERRRGQTDPPEHTVLVRSTWPSLPYRLLKKNNAPWLECLPARGSTPERSSALTADVVAIRVNPAGLAAGEYRETLEVSAWAGANAPAVTVTFRVVDGDPAADKTDPKEEKTATTASSAGWIAATFAIAAQAFSRIY